MSHKKLKVKDIDLLVAYKKKKAPSKYAPILKYAIPPFVLAIVVLGVFGFFTLKNYQLKNEIDDITTKISNLQNEIANDPNLSKFNELENIQKNTEKYKELYDSIQSYAQPTQIVFDQMVVAAGINVKITSFSYARDNQNITIDVETSNVSSIEQFVRDLKLIQNFSDVTYTGYSMSERVFAPTTNSTKDSASSTSTVYATSIHCKLK